MKNNTKRRISKILQKNKMVIGLGVVAILVGFVGSGYMLYTNARQADLAKVASAEAREAEARLKRSEASTPDIKTIAPTPPTPKAQPTESYSPNSIAGEKERMKDPEYRKKNLAPFAIRSVTIYGNNVLSCEIGEGKIYTQYAVITTNYALGGTVSWQLEARQNGTVSVLLSKTGTVADLEGIYETPNLAGYSTPKSSPDSGIRVHVTSPNDIASAWYSPTSCPSPTMGS